ncbi:EamA/RhaT family transporter [Legionella taurinensis]|uniref:DMT family transporter n=1 Tax=Legionella taurinensis TaxID=70611 RepID=A0A3A5LGE1_9GAMM|nr:EamA/RhaT family transporter [Legionella taurinensis]PUT39518.1 EamA/RhaT family transporter [Legionella taurinensis]PUT43979.1 EamA/RhaT family transporter [Legionella taurinensis]PUT45021.1 EamA/RhaT family transporter [Legionella taurinensis]RJT45593.1 DMT family transporter [Legionella taurinensis]
MPRGFYLFSRSKGVLYCLLSGLFFGLIGYFGITVIHEHISVYTMLFWRFMVAGLFIALIMLWQRDGLKLTRRDFLTILSHGIFFYGACSILYFIAANYIGSGLAMVVFFTYPALVMLINKLVYQLPFNLIYCISLLIIFSGMVFLVQGGQFHFNPIGLILSILSALLYAFYILASKKSRVSPLPSTLVLCLGCMVISLITALLDRSFTWPASWSVWANILGIGILCTALPILLLLNGLKLISSTQASILSVLEPVFVVIFGILLLGEQVSLMQMMGVSIILLGSLLSLLNERHS